MMRNISIFTLFYKSLYSLKSIAKYRFLGIGKTIQYIFMIALLFFLPGLYNILMGEGVSTIVSNKSLMPIFIIFMYVFNAGLIFIKITILSGVGLLFAKLLDKKLVYRHSWRLTAYSITLPTILFSYLPLMVHHIPGGLWLDLALSLLILFGSIKQIPSAKKIK